VFPSPLQDTNCRAVFSSSHSQNSRFSCTKWQSCDWILKPILGLKQFCLGWGRGIVILPHFLIHFDSETLLHSSFLKKFPFVDICSLHFQGLCSFYSFCESMLFSSFFPSDTRVRILLFFYLGCSFFVFT